MLPNPAAAHTCCPLLQRRLAFTQPGSSIRSSERHRNQPHAAAYDWALRTAHLHSISCCGRPATAAHAAATDTAEQTVPDSRQQLDEETDTQAKDQAEADFASFKDVDRPRWHITAPRGWVNGVPLVITCSVQFRADVTTGFNHHKLQSIHSHLLCCLICPTDPNAPLLHDGTYHLFFQHLPDRIEWCVHILFVCTHTMQCEPPA